MKGYEPEAFWDQKAVLSGGDARSAVCYGDPLRDECVDRIQARLLEQALSWLASRRPLHGVGVLDHGCGTGRWFGALSQRGCRYQGVDISREMIALARRHHPGGRFAKTNGAGLPFPDRQFGVVVSLAVLHHNGYERQEALLGELSRVLEPAGSLLLLEGIGRRCTSGEGPFFYRPAQDWLSALGSHGLRCVWQRAVRYFTLASLGAAVARRLGRTTRASPRVGGVERLLLRLDRIAGPFLLSRKPRRFHDRWFAVLAKEAG